MRVGSIISLKAAWHSSGRQDRGLGFSRQGQRSPAGKGSLPFLHWAQCFPVTSAFSILASRTQQVWTKTYLFNNCHWSIWETERSDLSSVTLNLGYCLLVIKPHRATRRSTVVYWFSSTQQVSFDTCFLCTKYRTWFFSYKDEWLSFKSLGASQWDRLWKCV